jgi:AraC-like DNA-binding protein
MPTTITLLLADEYLGADSAWWDRRVSREQEQTNRLMLRARDAIDRSFAGRLDIPMLAAIAHASEAHFIRTFRATFGETPHRYLQRRRVERAMFLLRTTSTSVTDICVAVGFTSLGTFSRTFRDIVGTTPSSYRVGGAAPAVPTCFSMAWTRPSSEPDRAVSEKQPQVATP